MGILSRIKQKKSKPKRKKYVKVKATVYEVRYNTGKRKLTKRFNDLNEARRFAKEAIMKGYDVESIKKRIIEKEIEGVTRKEVFMNSLGQALSRMAENAGTYYEKQHGSYKQKTTRKKSTKRKKKGGQRKRHKKHSSHSYDPFNANIFSW